MSSLPHADPAVCSVRSNYLYVIEVGADRIKVGVSYAPERRLAEHRRLANAFGATAGRHWVSWPDVGTADNESRLIEFCAKRATRQFSREYFAGLTFEEVVASAELLNGSNRHRRGWIYDPNPRGALASFDNVTMMRAQGSVAEAARWMDLDEDRIHELIESGELRVYGGEIPVIAMRRWLMSQPA